MRLLVDTHVLIGLSTGQLQSRHPAIAAGVAGGAHDIAASVVSLWEIAIKTRLGKLNPGMPLSNLAVFFETAGFSILPINRDHAVAEVWPEPSTRDPFDRLLLAQCKVEVRLLVSADGALVGHPLVADKL
ncbi:type II toxin-antitoxin system VapC family toxin [Methylorubrum sp. SB2]|uniref:type II toxin-antitoxin system VapC family toxin n=1 Tax=Methylorubrum subtropicum TaxID=3138812 RepID=UPI00313B092F